MLSVTINSSILIAIKLSIIAMKDRMVIQHLNPTWMSQL